jgi:hypothetical protein
MLVDAAGPVIDGDCRELPQADTEELRPDAE